MKDLTCGILVTIILTVIWIVITRRYAGNFTPKEAEAIFIHFGSIVFFVINGITFLIIWGKEI